MDIKTISITKPEDINFILGQTHFIKTVEDLYDWSRPCRASNSG